MTNLMNISLVFGLFLLNGLLAAQDVGTEQIQSRYCNTDFDFCANYPSSILTFKATLIQNNGIVLKSEDGISEVILAGFEQSFDRSTRDIFESTVHKIASPLQKPIIISSLFGEDFYECFFMVGHNSYYHKSFHFKDYFVRLEIRVPINRPTTMQDLREQISIDFDLNSNASIDKLTENEPSGGGK